MKVHVYEVVTEVVVELNRDIYTTDKVALKVALKAAKDLLDVGKILKVQGGKDDGLEIAPTSSKSIDPDGVLEWEAVRSDKPGCEHVAVIPEIL